MARGAWWVLLWAMACGGGGVAAFRGNEGYEPRRNDGSVEVFVHQRPSRPFDSVGIITVDGNLTARQVEEKAVAEARRVGCQLLIARELVDELGALAREPVLVAQVTSGGTLGPPGGGTIGGEKGAARRRSEFVCGVWRATP